VISDFGSVASAFQTEENAGICPWPALVHGPGGSLSAPGSFLSGGINSSSGSLAMLAAMAAAARRLFSTSGIAIVLRDVAGYFGIITAMQAESFASIVMRVVVEHLYSLGVGASETTAELLAFAGRRLNVTLF
jgi:hypothetical protein